MLSSQIRKTFIDFFRAKRHQIIPSSSLIPADSSVLFTTAGMQQFVPYLSGEVVPPWARAASCQKCFRTTDIDKVGDEFHHTFFEMLGNWSFGRGDNGYSKKQAIIWALEFLVDKLSLSKERIWVTVFKGEKSIPFDKESFLLWQQQGIPKERIYSFGMEDNFWGPTSETGPCGPCSEIYYDRGVSFKKRKCSQSGCGPGCNCGRFVEVWNLVFMEYNRKLKVSTKGGSASESYEYLKLPVKNIDTGAGLERLTCILQEKNSDYETDLFSPLIKQISRLSSVNYQENPKAFRIIADHLRGICFLIAEGILPSREDRGYILRRILRRAIRYCRALSLPKNFLISLAEFFISKEQNIYPELGHKKNDILTVIQNEEDKFGKTLKQGLKQFNKIADKIIKRGGKSVSGQDAFYLFETYGLPIEMTEEMAKEKGLIVLSQDFKQALKKHQEISRTGAKKKFGGHGLTGTESKEERARKTKLPLK